MSLQEQIAAAKERLATEKDQLSPEDRKELEARRELRDIENQIADEQLNARELDLARRMERARATLGPSVLIKGIIIEGYPDSFIVFCNGKAHSQWVADVSEAHAKQKADKNDVSRKYALAIVHDWNGEVFKEDLSNPELTVKLDQYLTQNPGILTPITNEGATLAGVYAKQYKS